MMRMGTHKTDQLEQILRMAALYRPHQLKEKALQLIRAFVFQHQALVTEATAVLEERIESGDIPSEDDRLSIYRFIADIACDIRQLEMAHDALITISPDYERAGRHATEATAEVYRESVLSDCLDSTVEEARAALEHILDHDLNTDDEEVEP